MIGEGQIWVEPITRLEQLSELFEAAKADKHEALFPTHIARKKGEIVGYLSVCATPVVGFWAHSEKCSPRDSLTLCNLGELLAANQGRSAVVVPCAHGSPFEKLMGPMGYKLQGYTGFWVKGLGGMKGASGEDAGRSTRDACGTRKEEASGEDAGRSTRDACGTQKDTLMRELQTKETEGTQTTSAPPLENLVFGEPDPVPAWVKGLAENQEKKL